MAQHVLEDVMPLVTQNEQQSLGIEKRAAFTHQVLLTQRPGCFVAPAVSMFCQHFPLDKGRQPCIQDFSALPTRSWLLWAIMRLSLCGALDISKGPAGYRNQHAGQPHGCAPPYAAELLSDIHPKYAAPYNPVSLAFLCAKRLISDHEVTRLL